MRTGTTDTAAGGPVTLVPDADGTGRPQVLLVTPPGGTLLTRRNAAPLLAQLLALLEPTHD